MRRATLLLASMLAVILLATGVAFAVNITGDGKNNYIKGTTGPDTLKGEGGADAIYGRPGDDTLEGGSDSDNYQTIVRYDKNNNPITAGLRGGGGNDTVRGGSGNDDVIGHTGDDTLEDNAPKDASDSDRGFGGPGKDTANVADGDTKDEVSCGTSTNTTTGTEDQDEVTIDVREVNGKIKTDKVYDCEVVKDQNGQPVDAASLPHMQPASEDYDPTPPAEPSSTEPA